MKNSKVLIGIAGSLGLVALALFLTLSGLLRVVVSNSMLPTYSAGDVIILRPVSDPITPGMVVTYQIDQRPITHRVVEVRGDQLVTRGDNNDRDDPWLVPVSKVLGVSVFSIPYLGYLLHFIRQPIGLILCVLIPCMIILFFELRSMKQVNSKTQDPKPSNS